MILKKTLSCLSAGLGRLRAKDTIQVNSELMYNLAPEKGEHIK
jgi:hypothetical protein